MTCAIHITSMTLLSDSTLIISGSAEGCASIEVQIIDFVTTVPKITQADAGGNWQVQFTGADVNGDSSLDRLNDACGHEVKISARCTADPTCQSPGMFPLTCLSCPPAESVFISVAAQTCTNGQRYVTLQAELPDASNTLFFEWVYGDGSSSNTQPLPAPAPGGSQVVILEPAPHAYAVPAQQGLNYPVSLHIFLASGEICVYNFPLHLEPCPPLDCFTVSLQVRDAANQAVDPSGCLPAGNYSVHVISPGGGGLSYAWSLDGAQDSTQTGSSYPLALNIGEAVSVSVIVSGDKCAVSNGVTLSECTQPEEPDEPEEPEEPGEPDKPDEPDEPDEPQDPGDDKDEESPPLSMYDPCWLWFWINLAAFIFTAIFILVTFCLIDANVWAAVAALASEGTLAGVWAALTATNVVMLILSGVSLLVCLISLILWIILCAFGHMRDIICGVLTLLMTILSILNGISFVVALILMFSSMVGCAVGAWIDVAWFSILMSITWFTGMFLGCFPFPDPFFARRRRLVQ